MAFTKATGLLATATALFSVVSGHSKEDYDHMGPLGFMWPEDREWSEDDALTAPCGVSGGVVNRTEFPVANGALALEQKQLVYDVQISIALDENPSNDTEFQVIVPSNRIQALSYSHVCLDLPSLVPDATAGTNATLQLRYVAEYIDPDHGHHRSRRHLPVNETFYSCADVTLVAAEAFALDIPCFNVTGSYDEQDTEEEPGHSHDEDEDHDAEEGHDDDDDEGDDDGGSGLGKGDIAGIVVGSVVGAAVLATVAWYLWRRDRREKQVAQHIMTENPEK